MEVLPERITKVLENALPELDKKLHGFAAPRCCHDRAGDQGKLVSRANLARGRTGSDICGLYPCGEGAGYAGGIMSAAVDGILTAEAILNE